MRSSDSLVDGRVKIEQIASLGMQLAVLGPPHLIDCFVEVFGHMKLVMHDFGLGRCLSGAAQVRLPHVDGDRFDLVTLLEPEPCPEFLASLSSAVRDNVQNPALFQISHEADIILPAAKALQSQYQPIIPSPWCDAAGLVRRLAPGKTCPIPFAFGS